jgi:hypothetical protein
MNYYFFKIKLRVGIRVSGFKSAMSAEICMRLLRIEYGADCFFEDFKFIEKLN